MFKALVKKQFLDIFSSFFRSRKNSQKRSTRGAAGMIIYFVVIMIFIAVMMYIFSGLFADSLLSIPDTSFDWFYFALMGIMAILLGTFGSIFSTMTALYQSKDNELLLSMPIPPALTLASRLIGIFVMSLLYSVIVWIPATVRYVNLRHPGGSVLIYCVILTILIALFVTVLSCAAGWVVALIAGKLRNKSFITVILFLILFGLYYFICFRMNTILAGLMARGDQIQQAIRSWIYPIYALGTAATGNTVSLLMFALITIVLAAICYLVLSRTFIRIATTNKGEKVAVYKEKTVAVKSVKSALFRREMMHFTKSATYMLNCGIGMVLMPAAAIVVAVYSPKIRAVLPVLFENAPVYLRIIPVFICAFVCLAAATNQVSAPSVSLEGKTIWLAQSLPVRTIDVLHAKEKMHIILNVIPSVISILILAWVFGVSPVLTVLMTAVVILFIIFEAGYGLKRGLKHPNLSWTNESVPIKQGAAVVISLFASWGFAVAGGGLYLLLLERIQPEVWLAIICAVLILMIWLNEKWMRNKGTRIFEGL